MNMELISERKTVNKFKELLLSELNNAKKIMSRTWTSEESKIGVIKNAYNRQKAYLEVIETLEGVINVDHCNELLIIFQETLNVLGGK